MIRRKRKGQMIIIASLIIAMLILSIGIIIQTNTTSYQKMRYYGVKEIVDNLNKDFDGMLTHSLGIATREYDLSRTPMVLADMQQKSFLNLTSWMKTAIRTFSSQGLSINLKPKNSLIQMNWTSRKASSVIEAEIAASASNVGFYGWNKTSLISLTMTFNSYYNFLNGSINFFNITILKENSIPMEMLSKSNLMFIYSPDGLNYARHNISNIFSIGGGIYNVTLLEPLPTGGYIKITGIDERGIYVSIKAAIPPIRVFYDTFTYTDIVEATTPPKGNWSILATYPVTDPGYPKIENSKTITVTDTVKQGSNYRNETVTDVTTPSGNKFLMMGYRDKIPAILYNPGTDIASISVPIPSQFDGLNVTTATVIVKYIVRSFQVSATDDFLQIKVSLSTAPQTDLLVPTYPRRSQWQGNWATVSSSYANVKGKTLTISIELRNYNSIDIGAKTWAYIDDVTVLVYF